jgi:hypothetical protein
MRLQDSTGGMSTSNGVGVKFPNYLQNPTRWSIQHVGGGNPQSWADRNRTGFANSLGLGNITGDDGRLDYSKAMGSPKRLLRLILYAPIYFIGPARIFPALRTVGSVRRTLSVTDNTDKTERQQDVDWRTGAFG